MAVEKLSPEVRTLDPVRSASPVRGSGRVGCVAIFTTVQSTAIGRENDHASLSQPLSRARAAEMDRSLKLIIPTMIKRSQHCGCS